MEQAFHEVLPHEGLDAAEALVLGDVDELVAEDQGVAFQDVDPAAEGHAGGGEDGEAAAFRELQEGLRDGGGDGIDLKHPDAFRVLDLQLGGELEGIRLQRLALGEDPSLLVLRPARGGRSDAGRQRERETERDDHANCSAKIAFP